MKKRKEKEKLRRTIAAGAGVSLSP